jgi:hypothetical protein
MTDYVSGVEAKQFMGGWWLLLVHGRKVASEHEEELTRGMSAADRKRLTALLQGIVEEQELGHGIHPGLSDPGGA